MVGAYQNGPQRYSANMQPHITHVDPWDATVITGSVRAGKNARHSWKKKVAAVDVNERMDGKQALRRLIGVKARQ